MSRVSFLPGNLDRKSFNRYDKVANETEKGAEIVQNPSLEDILKMISTTHRKTQMYLNDRLKPMGLTSGQVAFLLITCEQGKIVQNKFCDILDMDKSTVAKMLGKLEIEGFVTRKTNAEDCRSIDVYPTQQAREIYPKLREIGEGWGEKMTDGMSEVEKAVFFELLKKVTGNVVSYFS